MIQPRAWWPVRPQVDLGLSPGWAILARVLAQAPPANVFEMEWLLNTFLSFAVSKTDDFALGGLGLDTLRYATLAFAFLACLANALLPVPTIFECQ